MILATGPTASGKTTTLYALLHELVEESRHVVTVEDPVEYEIDGINQIEIDERHELDFAEGARTSLRLDPNCLMVGEVREDTVATQAVSASIQGHVVMATMHSRDAVSAVTRLRNFGVADHKIATAPSTSSYISGSSESSASTASRPARPPISRSRFFPLSTGPI